MTIIHQNGWETFEVFDFSSVINRQDVEDAKTDIDRFIAEGKYFRNSPPFQTQVNLFGLHEPHWLKFRMSFIFSCFMYLGKEAKITNMQAWSFRTNSSNQEDRETHWHTHQYDNEHTLSGLMYLEIPDDANRETSGTEFAVNGVEDSARWTSPVLDYHWLIYPGKTYHRPTAPQSSKNRYILAADLCIGIT
jgi:hypothetical protein